MSSILDKIVATKRVEIQRARQTVPEAALRDAIQHVEPARGFFRAIANGDGIKLIAEIKKASPSKGIIRHDFDPVAIASAYSSGGATCLSVLTDEQYFHGNLGHLRLVRDHVSIPLLRKDFILDSYQLLEARLHGADAVLLIAECLDDCNLRKLHNEAIDLGMTPLVEFYEPTNLRRVLEAGADLIGINNRDLNTFAVDLEHTIRLRRQIPADCLVVGESGIHSHDDVRRLEDAGVNAILVGEHLMASDDIGLAVRRLLGRLEDVR